jgi:hypothetical protein
MRSISANATTLLALDNVSFAYLVHVIAPTETLLDTTAAIPITVSGLGVTFQTGNGLSMVEAPKLSQAVDRETYKILYVDPSFSKRQLFEDGVVGSEVNIYVCFLNTTNGTLGGAAPGQYLTDVADLIIAYSGVIDTTGYAVEPEEGTAVATLECSSPMAALNLTKLFMTTKDALRKINPDDSAFDQVGLTSSKTAYLWGKA